MKKLLSILLALVLMLGCASALAEESAEIVPAFQVSATVPEGFTSEGLDWVDPFICYMTLMPSAEGKPGIMMVISYNDAFSDITFNDEMAEEDFDAQVALLTSDEETGDTIPFEVRKTGLGTKVVQLNHGEGYNEFYTIWHGYEVSLHCANFDAENNSAPLTEEQVAEILQFLTDLDMTTVIEEVEQPAA